MAGVGSGDLHDALVEFHNAVYAALADTVGGQPSCVYISEGPPSWDTCPCLTTWVGTPSTAGTFPLTPVLAPLARVGRYGAVFLVTMTALILRCAPTMTEEAELPSPAEHLLAAEETNSDLWAVWNHLASEKRTGALFPPNEREFELSDALAVSGGGCAGWQIPIRVQIDGFRPI